MVDAFLAHMSLSGVAVENLQARVRGVILMALSNEYGHLVLTTGNKSELAVGYSTLYGDSVGGFNPIKDVPKTLVWRLAEWRNAEAVRRGETPPIPENSITKPPSAELRPEQLDSGRMRHHGRHDQLGGAELHGVSPRQCLRLCDDEERLHRCARQRHHLRHLRHERHRLQLRHGVAHDGQPVLQPRNLDGSLAHARCTT